VGIFGTALGTYLLTFFGVFGIVGDGDSAKAALVVYVFCIIFGIILIRWAYKKFRYGGEVEEGTGIVKPPSKSMLKKSGTVSTVSNVFNAGNVVNIASSFLRR
jgi:hypothetical protein